MESLIKQAFVSMEIEKHVMERRYDLEGPHGIILPEVWDATIEPDWSITMKMWPIEPPRHETFVIPPHLSGGKFKPRRQSGRGGVPPPPPLHNKAPPPPGWIGDPPVIIGNPPDRPRAKKNAKSALSWIAGSSNKPSGKGMYPDLLERCVVYTDRNVRVKKI
jgi:hypothetical protein